MQGSGGGAGVLGESKGGRIFDAKVIENVSDKITFDVFMEQDGG